MGTGFRVLERNYHALSVFRIVFSVYLLADFLSYGMCCFQQFYTEAGVLPFSALSSPEIVGDPVIHRMLLIAESVGFTEVFPFLYCPTLVSFGIGFKTRWSNGFALLLSSYLHLRNPYITSGADSLADLMLLWCLFLPVNRYWSVDAVLEKKERERPYPLLPFLIIKLQVCSMYLFPALVKLTGEPWRKGYAVIWALSDNTFGATPAGIYLVNNFPSLLYFANYAIMAFQLAFPLLIFCPWRNDLMRAIALSFAAAMHVSFIFCLHIGNFPYISLTALLVLFSDSWITRLTHRGRLMTQSQDALAPWVNLRPIASGASLFAGLLALLGLITNIQSITRLPRGEEIVSPSRYMTVLLDIAVTLQVAQRWYIFAPAPTHFRREYQVLLAMNNGSVIDFTFEQPALFRTRPDGGIDFINQRWLKYFTRMEDFSEAEWAALGRFICRQATASNRVPALAIRRVGLVTGIDAGPYKVSAIPGGKVSHHWFDCSVVIPTSSSRGTGLQREGDRPRTSGG